MLFIRQLSKPIVGFWGKQNREHAVRVFNNKTREHAMKSEEPHIRSNLVLRLLGLLVVVVLSVVAAIKLREAIGGSLGTIVFAIILAGLGILVRRLVAPGRPQGGSPTALEPDSQKQNNGTDGENEG